MKLAVYFKCHKISTEMTDVTQQVFHDKYPAYFPSITNR